jgi:hypothetical protein
MLQLDEDGRFVDPTGDERDCSRRVSTDDLPRFLRRNVSLPKGVTDVFVWVHGWQNDEARAIDTARRLFANLEEWLLHERNRYPRLGEVVPAFVAVHWPSASTPGPLGYRRIRDRAVRMTTEGEAASFLALLLGYLDEKNERAPDRKVLLAKDGYYIHCLGHSLGGRFLTAAIQSAASPVNGARKVLGAAHRNTGFEFNVDSLCVLQMAAGARSFGVEYSRLLGASPLCGPIVLTYSTADRALCAWHTLAEFEVGVGCKGAASPEGSIGSAVLRSMECPYSDFDFRHDITNVDASHIFTAGGWAEGAHSDFWHCETLHLIASVVERTRIDSSPLVC